MFNHSPPPDYLALRNYSITTTPTQTVRLCKMPDLPTATNIITTQSLPNTLTHKTILITGCSSGLGTETARALAQTGATIFLAVRDLSKGRQVLSDILDGARVRLLRMDLGSFASIRRAVTEFLKHSSWLHVLICNGAVMATPRGERTEDGFEMQFGTNHLGHFLLVQLLLPVMLRSATTPSTGPESSAGSKGEEEEEEEGEYGDGEGVRIIGVTSSAHRHARINFADLNLETLSEETHNIPQLAYAQSKTANIYMMNEIERRFGARGVHGLSVHPGNVFTGLQKYIDESVLAEWRQPEMKGHLKSVEQGAASIVVAAVGREWEGVGGVYLEDCKKGEVVREGYRSFDPGFEEHAFDEEAERRLWEVSLGLVGLA